MLPALPKGLALFLWQLACVPMTLLIPTGQIRNPTFHFLTRPTEFQCLEGKGYLLFSLPFLSSHPFPKPRIVSDKPQIFIKYLLDEPLQGKEMSPGMKMTDSPSPSLPDWPPSLSQIPHLPSPLIVPESLISSHFLPQL